VVRGPALYLEGPDKNISLKTGHNKHNNNNNNNNNNNEYGIYEPLSLLNYFPVQILIFLSPQGKFEYSNQAIPIQYLKVQYSISNSSTVLQVPVQYFKFQYSKSNSITASQIRVQYLKIMPRPLLYKPFQIIFSLIILPFNGNAYNVSTRKCRQIKKGQSITLVHLSEATNL
jgi:hypothetical protein